MKVQDLDNETVFAYADLPVEDLPNFPVGNTLYIAYGEKSGGRAVYVGFTRNSLSQRNLEHHTLGSDRPYEFDLHGYRAFELPQHWLIKNTTGEVALAEDLVLYTLNHTLIGTGSWLDNRRYSTKIRGVDSHSISEVMGFLDDNVYPRLEDIAGKELVKEPAPMLPENPNPFRIEYYYVNGTRGCGFLENDARRNGIAEGWNIQ